MKCFQKCFVENKERKKHRIGLLLFVETNWDLLDCADEEINDDVE